MANHRRLVGFTLVELLVVIAIIGVLVALLLPAIQAARESARNAHCKNNLKNVGLAMMNHHDTLRKFPTGGSHWGIRLEHYVENGRNVATEKMGVGWGYQLLPYLEQNAVHGLVTQEQVQDNVIPIYSCPSRRPPTRIADRDGGWVRVLTDYAGIQPCTTIGTDPELVDMTPGVLTYPKATEIFYQSFAAPRSGGDDVEAVGPAPSDNTVYDGVIVRASYWRTPQQNDRTPGIEFVQLNNVPQPVKVSQISDGTSNTMMVSEKYVRVDWAGGGMASDDTGWSDGWDPDVMRLSCIQPLNDGAVNPRFTGHIGVPQGETVDGAAVWETMVMGSAHPGGVNIVFADASVHGISFDIDVFTLNAMGTRDGGETVDANQLR